MDTARAAPQLERERAALLIGYLDGLAVVIGMNFLEADEMPARGAQPVKPVIGHDPHPIPACSCHGFPEPALSGIKIATLSLSQKLMRALIRKSRPAKGTKSLVKEA